MGGTMRLGEYECETKEGSNLRNAYDTKLFMKDIDIVMKLIQNIEKHLKPMVWI